MNDNLSQVLEKISVETPTLQSLQVSFLSELRKAEAGEASSLSFLKNFIPAENMLGEGDVLQVMAIGGSNFHNGSAKRASAGYSFDEIEKKDLPRLTTKEVFFEFILANLLENTTHLALNFAYPLATIERDGLLDGRLMGISKEHQFSGLVGELVGESFEKYFAAKIGREIKVTVANDTVCAILAGAGMVSDIETLAGGIVGTGINFGLNKAGYLVNLESGNFSKFQLSEAAAWVDQNSIAPGTQTYEKETSGGYLFQHFNYYNKQYNLGFADIVSTEKLSGSATAESPEAKLAIALLSRSAAFVAMQIAGIYAYKKQAKMTFVMEGSLFWKGHRYLDMVKQQLNALGLAEDAITFERIENSYLLGAAYLFGL